MLFSHGYLYAQNSSMPFHEKCLCACQVDDNISYSCFTGLMNTLMSRGSNIPQCRKIFTNFLEKKKPPFQKTSKSRRSILLVDEVDIFFGDAFYGRNMK
jgi:hypothetical protein